ncbi:GNAT family N-acetyltransferase [Paenibacillus chitinolyticus]|uniref:GNAT family N-acetyltransferase n=1 Tax=Paenibacillus chitinolyticus TaxID=79263 RepID=UPI0036DCDD8C
MLFESSRVLFRKMTEEDAAVYHTWRNDMEVMRTTNPFLDLSTYAETRQFVEQVILGSDTSKSYMILDKPSGRAIGITSLIQLDYKNRSAECILDIGEKEFWGKGYGTESLRLLLNYAFLELNLHRISLRVFAFNDKAVALYEKIGFKREGISRQAVFREGQWHDILHMGMLQEEYKAD